MDSPGQGSSGLLHDVESLPPQAIPPSLLTSQFKEGRSLYLDEYANLTLIRTEPYRFSAR